MCTLRGLNLVAGLLSIVVGVMLGAVACVTTPPTGRVIPLVPGFPLPASTIHVETGDEVTWVNGDPARGEIRIEFDHVPGMPAATVKGDVYTARFGTPGTYAYTVTPLGRTGQQLIPRRGEVVVRERGAAVPSLAEAKPIPPVQGPAQAPPPAQSAPSAQPAPSALPAAEVPPVGVEITRMKGSNEVYAAYQYRPEQGVLLKVERGTALPSPLRAGSQVILAVTYSILAPRDARPVTVKEVRTIRFGDQDLRRLEKEVTVDSGTYSSEHRLTVPSDAAEGPYTVTTIVEVPAAARVRGQISSTFSVILP
jgi:hypothetical protein